MSRAAILFIVEEDRGCVLMKAVTESLYQKRKEDDALMMKAQRRRGGGGGGVADCQVKAVR
jgi:hypothetical protein